VAQYVDVQAYKLSLLVRKSMETILWLEVRFYTKCIKFYTFPSEDKALLGYHIQQLQWKFEILLVLFSMIFAATRIE
jgi:hypothetical protein